MFFYSIFIRAPTCTRSLTVGSCNQISKRKEGVTGAMGAVSEQNASQ